MKIVGIIKNIKSTRNLRDQSGKSVNKVEK